jgi:hypothetical protein
MSSYNMEKSAELNAHKQAKKKPAKLNANHMTR